MHTDRGEVARSTGRRSARTATGTVRRLTTPWRALPDFVVVGAQKAGTTSMYAYLCAHPDVVGAARKEVHYFDVNYGKGESWYRSMFPLRARVPSSATPTPPRRITGEASPYYLFHPLAAQRAAALVPTARIIILLRDPVERAWSHYRHEVAAGRETLEFHDAITAEPVRLAGAEADIVAGRYTPASRLHRTASYVSRGRYAEQLRPWLSAFPDSSVLVIRAEDMFERTETEYRRTTAFLGLRDAVSPVFDVHNPGAANGIPAEGRARLEEIFAQPNAELADLLGPGFTWPTTK